MVPLSSPPFPPLSRREVSAGHGLAREGYLVPVDFAADLPVGFFSPAGPDRPPTAGGTQRGAARHGGERLDKCDASLRNTCSS